MGEPVEIFCCTSSLEITASTDPLTSIVAFYEFEPPAENNQELRCAATLSSRVLHGVKLPEEEVRGQREGDVLPGDAL